VEIGKNLLVKSKERKAKKTWKEGKEEKVNERGELCLKRYDFQADPHSDFYSEHGGTKTFYYLICRKSFFELRKL
jgi:hypothetical protein